MDGRPRNPAESVWDARGKQGEERDCYGFGEVRLTKLAAGVVFAVTATLADPPESTAQFDVSGTITVSAASAVDSDVNDPNAPYASNDGFAEGQTIPTPGRLGGYLNYPGAGAEGRSKTSGDVVDVFRAFLPAGAQATLFIAEDDGAIHDLDLLLYDASDSSAPVDSSLGTETTEQVEAANDGAFDIVVMVAPGASQTATTYLLVFGQDPTLVQESTLRLHHEFVTGQVIARFDDSGGAGSSASALAARVDLVPRAGAAGREILLEQGHEGGSGVSALQTMAPGPAVAAIEALLPADPELREKLDTLWMVKRLRRRAEVVAADPNYLREITATPNDALYDLQWHYPLINLPQAWDVTTGSSDTVVAVIDTGVLRDHPDLEGSLLEGVGSGYDFVSSPFLAKDGDGIDPDWNDPGDVGCSQTLSSFHGTHVSGTVAAATDNLVGVAGVNWNARIMPVRALGRCGIGNVFDILQAVRYAAGLPNDSGTFPQQVADIMNLSLGGDGSSQAEQDVYTQAREAGVIIVAAAGNSRSGAPFYPAAYDGVVSVSAVDIEKELAYYSNFGDTIDVAAPGGNTLRDLNGDGYADGVLSTLAEDAGLVTEVVYAFYQGTSMASPHMAGVVSLMKARNPNLSPADLDTLLVSGAITDDLGLPGRDDEFGRGLINALKAVQAAGGPVADPPELSVTPSGLNFGVSDTEATISVSNAGGDSLVVNDVTDDAPWLTVTATDVDASGLGLYTATVARGGLTEAIYNATITFDSTAGVVDVPVVMLVAGSGPGDAGFHYIRLVDAGTLATVAEVGVAASNGAYDFLFTGVPGGTYLLAAGSDADNDASLCETGEACGGYPLLNELVEIAVDQTVSGLEFNTGYLTLLPEPSGRALALGVWLALIVSARMRRTPSGSGRVRRPRRT